MDSSESSSSDTSDEEIEIIGRINRPKPFRNQPNQFSKYGDDEFRVRYRFCKQTVAIIISMLEEGLKRTTNRNAPVPPEQQLFITLQYYACGSFQNIIGDDFGVHKSTVCRIVNEVTEHIAALRPEFVKMPVTNSEMQKVKKGFLNISCFPNVIGCIDGTHVPIQSPGGDDAKFFRNKRGNFSINVQVVCDSNFFINDITARWPGSTQDIVMFNASVLRARLEAGEFNDSYLLGDSAYICKKYLLTPVLHPNSPPTKKYNKLHDTTMNSIKRTLVIWKRRFGCLTCTLRTKINTTLNIIVATSVLHNIARIHNDVDDFEESILNHETEECINDKTDIDGNAFRLSIIRNYF